MDKVWKPGEWAVHPSRIGIPLSVWIHTISECGRYAVISYSQRANKKHHVLVK
jgi:hypothetical protein